MPDPKPRPYAEDVDEYIQKQRRDDTARFYDDSDRLRTEIRRREANDEPPLTEGELFQANQADARQYRMMLDRQEKARTGETMPDEVLGALYGNIDHDIQLPPEYKKHKAAKEDALHGAILGQFSREQPDDRREYEAFVRQLRSEPQASMPGGMGVGKESIPRTIPSFEEWVNGPRGNRDIELPHESKKK